MSLEIDIAYFYPKENAQRHHTENFELLHDEEFSVPILRRGQRFTIAIRFRERNFEEGLDLVRFVFSYGPNPNVIKGTKGVMKLTSTRNENLEHANLWKMNLSSQQDDNITVDIVSPVDCPVGIWNFMIETNTIDSTEEPTIYAHQEPIYMLFNPWTESDITFMPDHRLLDEYVLNDVGKIWVGPMGTCRGREWVFGQFDACILPACMLMLEKSGLPPTSRGDPIMVTRTISKMVNTNDDDGILEGRWDGMYEDGTAPAGWTGSVEILRQYLETQQSVKYGQCWVFSGVITTICRALGIPSRVVSNLVSAHDANRSLTVDKYYGENNEELDFDPLNPMGEDSIWNYHVWNDVWMARPDLPTGYGGWQAIDGTPQEQSSGFFQCGPAPLEAIRQGAVGLNYDVGFMLASVNADLMRWKVDPQTSLGYTKIFCNKNHVGRLILTKEPWIFDPNGDGDRQDITDQYKEKEGTQAERLALYKAVRGTHLAKSFYELPDPGLEDLSFSLRELEKINIGEPFSVTVEIENKSDEVRTIKAVLSAGSVFYTGIKAHVIKKAQGEFTMQPNSTEQLRMTIQAEDYLDKLVEYCILKLYAVASVEETRQTWADEDDFQVVKPNIEIQIPNELPIRQQLQITLTFKNPLHRVLTNCKFNIAGPGLKKNQSIPYQDVEPLEDVRLPIIINPTVIGSQKLVATFTSRELLDITGSAQVEVFYDE